MWILLVDIRLVAAPIDPSRIALVRRRGVIAILLLGCAASACTPGYPTHPAAELRPGATRRVGCVEFGVEAERDATLPVTSILVQISLKNKCSDSAPVDLNALLMWADRTNGERFELTFYDPRKEIVPLHLQTESEGVERLEVLDAGSPGSLRQICFDPTRITGGSKPTGAICYLFDQEASYPAAPEIPNEEVQ